MYSSSPFFEFGFKQRGEVFACVAFLDLDDVFGGARGDDFAAAVAAFGAYV